MGKIKKKKNVNQLKKLADKLCSEWTRRKDADRKEEVACYTCLKRLHWKEIQAGHYISRVYLNTRYYEPNLKPQCYFCNVMKHGAMDEFALRLEKETPGILETLNRYKKTPSTPMSWQDWNMLIEDFKSKISKLN